MTVRTLRRRVCAVLVLALGVPVPVLAQVASRVDLDNDSFNFWQPPNRRADREYTQGTRVRFLWPSANRLARRLLGGTHQCSGPAVTRDCRMLSVGLSQAIYTPTLDLRTRTVNERAFAGWLGADLGLLRDRDDQLTEFTLSVGVTGPPSLAEPAQKAVHRTFGFRPPVGWDTQLPTEVAFAAAYQGARNIVRLRSERSGLRLLVAPLWSARIGTLATDASAGLELTAGLRPPSPWQTQPNARGDRWGLFARAGAAQRLVGRNLFLDGSTFGGGIARVPRERWVSEMSLGVGVRLPEGMLVEWRLHNLSREYQRQPKAHAYSTFAFALR